MALKVYALSTCPYCRMARKFLDDNGVTYDVVEVDKLEGQEKSDTVAEVKKMSGGTSFPVLTDAGQVVVGFDKTRIARLAGIADE